MHGPRRNWLDFGGDSEFFSEFCVIMQDYSPSGYGNCISPVYSLYVSAPFSTAVEISDRFLFGG